MIEDLQTLSTANLRRHHSAAAAAAGAPDSVGVGSGAPNLVAPRPGPPPIDRRVVDALFEFLTMTDNPCLQCESVHTLAVLFDRLVPERQQDVQDVAVPVLLGLLRSDNERATSKAGAAVRDIVSWDGDVPRNVVLGALVRGIVGDDDPAILRKHTADCRRILTIEPDPPIQKVVESGVVRRLVELLQRDEDPELQREAAWALTNVASGDEERTTAVVEVGAIPAFVRLLGSPNDDVAAQAAEGLASVAADNPDHRDAVLRSGAVPPLLELLRHRAAEPTVLRSAARALSNVCCAQPRSDFELTLPALPALAQLIARDDDDDVVVDACRALKELTSLDDGRIQEAIDAGVCPRLVELLRHPNPDVQGAAIRAVANLTSGSDPQAQAVLDQNPFPSLRALLSSPNVRVRDFACLSIANLLVDSQGGIQAAIDSGTVPTLIQLVGDAEPTLRGEAVRAICNVTFFGTVEQIQVAVAEGCIPPLCGVLTVDAPESGVVSNALDGLGRILLAGWAISQRDSGAVARFGPTANPMAMLISSQVGGLWKLRELRRHHPDAEIRRTAGDVLERYFGIGENGVWDAAAAAEPSGAGGDGDGIEPPRQRPRLS